MHAIVQTLWHSSLPPIRQGIATPRLLGSCRKDGYRSSPFEELCSPGMDGVHACSHHTTRMECRQGARAFSAVAPAPSTTRITKHMECRQRARAFSAVAPAPSTTRITPRDVVRDRPQRSMDHARPAPCDHRNPKRTSNPELSWWSGRRRCCRNVANMLTRRA